MTKLVQVAVGVVVKQGQFFVCRRKQEQDEGGKWEFPGGKLEAEETPIDALKRELKEEIGIYNINQIQDLLTIEFDYEYKKVELFVFLVKHFDGDACGLEGQETQWISFLEVQKLDFPKANLQILEKLRQLGY